MSVTFIGDVHGWSDRLDAVLSQAEGDLVFLGDLIDRGPDAPGVLARVQRLCEDGRARCVLGNHEYALLRAIGIPQLRLAPDDDWFDAWSSSYGGETVLDAYRARTADALRRAIGEPRLAWLASLPWVLEGEEDGQHWIAVHAGMHPAQPLASQLRHLREGWSAGGDRPYHLYDKNDIRLAPGDMPPGTVLVSGHTPQPRAVVTARRILCDTSGGRIGRTLSAVIWPAGRVITS